MNASLLWCVLVVGRPRSGRAPLLTFTSISAGPFAFLRRSMDLDSSSILDTENASTYPKERAAPGREHLLADRLQNHALHC